MKKILLLLVIALPIISLAQEKNKKIKITLNGYIKNDMIFNTRQVSSARGEHNMQLLPEPELLDKEGKDINNSANFNIGAFSSRLKIGITGPDAFGAKTSGVIESDFLGASKKSRFNLRLRKAFVKLQWENTSLIAGQNWHASCPTECLASTVSEGAGAPFSTISRVPQVRLKHTFGDFSVMGAILSQTGKKILQNSIIPEAHLQLKFNNENISAGAGINFQSLRPKLESNKGYITNTRVNSLSYLAYAKLKTNILLIKLYGIYGQNNDNLLTPGGFATRNMNYTNEQITKGFVEYDCYNVYSTWLDIETTGEKLKFGLFSAYTKNLGAKEKIDVSTYVGRWHNINSMIRISPRVKYIANKVVLGFEMEYTTVAYAKQKLDENGLPVIGSDIDGINEKGYVTNSNSVNNIKLILSISYKF